MEIIFELLCLFLIYFNLYNIIERFDSIYCKKNDSERY